MDSRLEQARTLEESPFNGVTLTTIKSMPVPEMAKALNVIVSLLNQRFDSEQLYFLYDWLEHDGVVLESKPATWECLAAEVETADNLLVLFRNGDTYVRRGYYVENHAFYLRFYVNEPGYAGTIDNGDFDVTCSLEVANEICQSLERTGIITNRVKPAFYFDERDSR